MERSDEIASRVLEKLSRKVGASRPIDLDSGVIADTGLDSVSVMDFVMELEDEFDITISLDRIAEVRTVRDLAEVVGALLQVDSAAHAGQAVEGR